MNIFHVDAAVTGIWYPFWPHDGMVDYHTLVPICRTRQPGVAVYMSLSSKEYKEASTFLHSSEKHLSLTSDLNSQLQTHCEN